jgi:ankyrin repeat protein
MIVQACRAGDMDLLRQWAKRGIRVTSATPLCATASNGKLDAVRLLVMELGADVTQLHNGFTALCIAAHRGHEHVVRALVQEFGADVNQVTPDGCSPLYAAAHLGHEHIVRCLVKEFGANVNIAARDGTTPLMAAAVRKHTEIVVWLTKHGADSQASHPQGGTAADFSKLADAPAEQTAYLEARTHCAKPGCSGAGLKKCAGCLVIFYCCKECQVAHWSKHKAECKRGAGLAAGKGNN